MEVFQHRERRFAITRDRGWTSALRSALGPWLTPVSVRVWRLTTVLWVLAAITFWLVPRTVEPVNAPLSIPWWLLAALVYLTEVRVVHLQVRGNLHTFSLSELPLVLGLFFTAPLGLLAAQVIGLTAAQVQRKLPLGKIFFNVGSSLFTLGVAVLVFDAFAVGHRRLATGDWAGASIALLLGTTIETLLVLLAITMSHGRPGLAEWWKSMATGIVGAMTTVCLALAAVTLLWSDRRAWWLLVMPTVVLYFCYRAYSWQRQRSQSLEALYRSSRVLHRTVWSDTVTRELLTRARSMLRCEKADFVLYALDDSGLQVHASLGPGEDEYTVVTAERLGPDVEAWAHQVSGGDAILLGRSIIDSRGSKQLRQLGLRDAVIAPLRTEAGVIGTMMVANRRGGDTFGKEDLRLFETLANHASMSLENGRLMDRLRAEAAEKEHQATHDSLTSLPNRTLFRDRLEHAIATAKRQSEVLAVMLMDLDRFKEINDTLGHHNGDLLLVEVGRRLRKVLREQDTAARLSGDEFAIVLPAVADYAAARTVAGKILDELKKPFVLQDVSIDIGASIGVALYPHHGEDANTLLQRADVAMYLAKASHSGCEVYVTDRDEYSPTRLALAGELRMAIDRHELTVHYQPKVDMKTRQIVGMEALVRWMHPLRGFMTADEFVPLAEQTGLIKQLTLVVLRDALFQCRRWRDAGLDFGVSINLSVRSLMDIQLPDDIARLLQENGLPPQALVLEITESSFMADPPRALEVVSRLHALGVRLAIDDFGTGYSSLAYLKRLPVDEIKIDKSFVMGMTIDDNDAVIVRSTVDLGRNLGLRVVAEGVEGEQTWDELIRLGCGVAQGHLVSRPLPPEKLHGWVARWAVRSMAAGTGSDLVQGRLGV